MPPSVPPSPTGMNPPIKKLLRFQGLRWFLTLPQSIVDRKQAYLNLQNRYPEMEWCVIASETHLDGSPHLHIALEFKDKLNTRDMSYFDEVGDKHPNIQPMKNKRKCIAYVTKGGAYDAYGIDVKAILEKKCGKFTIVAKQLISGTTLDQLNETEPGFMLQHRKKCEDYLMWIQRRNEREKKKEWKKFLTADIQDLNTAAEMQIACWLNLNIKEPREFRQDQLYIHGPPGIGKSHLIEQLSEYLNIYHIPRDEDFYDDYEDKIYDLAVLDEFTNQKTMQWLNQFLDGQPMYLRKKGGQILKKQRIPVLIISNYKLEQNFHKLYEQGKLQPLLTRLKVVEIQERIDLFQ